MDNARAAAAAAAFDSFILPSNCELGDCVGFKKKKQIKATKERKKKIIQGIGIEIVDGDRMLSSQLCAVNSQFAQSRHHSGCVIMQVFIEGIFAGARGHGLANRAQQVALRQKALACFYSISRSLTQQIHTQ